MLDSMDTGAEAPPELTPEQIIKDFMWLGPAAYFKENLHDLFIAFVAGEDNMDAASKDAIIFTYMSLRNFLISVETIQLKNQQKS